MLDVITSMMAPMLVTSIGISAPQDTTRTFEVTAQRSPTGRSSTTA